MNAQLKFHGVDVGIFSGAGITQKTPSYIYTPKGYRSYADRKARKLPSKATLNKNAGVLVVVKKGAFKKVEELKYIRKKYKHLSVCVLLLTLWDGKKILLVGLYRRSNQREFEELERVTDEIFETASQHEASILVGGDLNVRGVTWHNGTAETYLPVADQGINVRKKK